MGRGGRYSAAIALLAAVVGVAWWLLGREQDERVRSAQRLETTAAATPSPEPPSFSDETDAAPDVLSPKPAAQPVVAVAPVKPDAGREPTPTPAGGLFIAGRVLDLHRAPIAGAVVELRQL